MRKDLLVSIICPLTKHTVDLAGFLNELRMVLASVSDQFEILFVDDRQADAKSALVDCLVRETAGTRVLRLSRPHGIEVAITAGLDSVIGDVVVILIPGLDPATLVPKFVERVLQTDGVVLGTRENVYGETLLSSVGRRIFYLLSERVFRISVPRFGTYFFALNRKAVTFISRTKDRRRFLRLLTAEIGLPISTLTYEMASEQSFRSFWASVLLSCDIITASTTSPLRLVFFFCLLACLVSISMGIASVNSLPLFIVYSLLAVALLGLAVVAEYIRLLVTESSQRPLYYVQEEIHSAESPVSKTARNVLGSST